jgi:hypothetical protein
LYESVKRAASKKFLAPTSAYKSAWIVREYKKRGGQYVGSKGSKGSKGSTGLTRWFRERWVDVATMKPCGRRSASSNTPYPLCRPSVRVSASTPTLVQTGKKTQEAYRQKQVVRNRGRVSIGR